MGDSGVLMLSPRGLGGPCWVYLRSWGRRMVDRPGAGLCHQSRGLSEIPGKETLKPVLARDPDSFSLPSSKRLP